MFSVVFEVRPGEGRRDAYLALAREMRPILESIDGFLANERFESRHRPGWLLSLSTWRDEKAVIRWRTEGRHYLTQGKGRAEIFADYHLRVGEIIADSAPSDGIPLREQRFDVTETGRAKALTVTELDPPDHHRTDAAAAGIAPGETMEGLVACDVFESITAPGKLLILGSWLGADAAMNFTPLARPGGVALRHRTVRVIRDYSLLDRREAPQFHPPVSRAG